MSPRMLDAVRGPGLAGAVLAAWVACAGAAQPTDAEKLASRQVRHDPAAAADFAPISAELGLVDIGATVSKGVWERLTLTVETGEPGGAGAKRLTIPMTRMAEWPEAGTERYTARVMAGARTIRYSMEASAAADPARPGSPRDVHVVGMREREIRPAYETPDWAKGCVWYQIFPERFRNGNAKNDPNGPGVFLAPWSSDWYQVQPGEMEAFEARRAASPDQRRRGQGLYSVIYDRRYGGDLQGVEQKLDDLRGLGVDAIYFNPIFQARSLHKYDASDFRHIDDALANPGGPSIAIDEKYYTPPAGETADPSTWTWTEADRYFTGTFLPAAKTRGLRVVLDGVWNHTGTEFFAFQDLKKNGKASPYAGWYIAEFDAAGKLTGWSGWERKNGYLPEFRQVKGEGPDAESPAEKGDLNAGVKRFVFDVTTRWMDPNGDGDPGDGIDGWRLDVAGEVGEKFWRDWRGHVKGINPQAITVAEIWSKAGELTKGNAFDTQMHYPFAYPVLEWLTNCTGEGKLVTSGDLSRRLTEAFGDAPQTQLVHQNLFASHDTDRYVNMLWNPGRGGYNHNNRQQNNDDKPRANDSGYVPYRAGRPPAEIYDLSILGVAIQAAYIGSPMVYYGDELGMWGANDPNCRKPTPWADTAPNKNVDDAIVPGHRERYVSWLRLRKDPTIGPILRLGSIRHVESGDDDVFAFERSLNGETVLFVANRGTAAFDASALIGGRATSNADRTVRGREARIWALPAR